jgi:integrase/recombinase XerD
MPRKKSFPGSIEKRGDKLRLRLCVGGERAYYTFTRGPDPKATIAAIEKFAREESERLEGQRERQRMGLPGPMPMSALLEKFEGEALPTLSAGTRRTYADSLKPVRAYFVDQLGDPAVDSVRAAHVANFLTWRRVNRLDGKAPLHLRTVQKDRTVLHRIFAFADRLEIRDGNPVARTERPKADSREPVILDAEQFEALLSACEGRPMLHLYILTLGETGGRCQSEVLHLRWEDVDLAEGFLRIASGRDGHRTKSGKGRWVPLTPRLLTALREHFAAYRFATYGGKRSPYLFHHTRTRRRHVAGERVKSFRYGFNKAAERAKLPAELHQHDLRHRRVTTWLAEGASPVLVKEAMGHSDLRTTMGYTHLAREHLRALVPQEKDEARRHG